MAISDDVLVVGGGLAGMTAAIAAARGGARTRLVSHKESTLHSASGLVDVLGYTPGGEGPLVDPFDRIRELPEEHPYRRVGESTVRDGLALFDEIIGDAYRGEYTDRNALVPTYGGTVKPTARYPATVRDGLASDDRDALFVGFERHPDFDAPLVAEHLSAAGVPFATRGVTVAFPGEFRTDARITRLAHALDENETVTTESGERLVRAALAERIAAQLDGEERVGVPAILGEDHPEAVRTDLSQRIGAAVFEVPTGPPSLPGMRLADRLQAALETDGVRVTSGNPVVDHESESGRIRAVYVDRTGRRVPYHADQFVLATGGLVGKGVDSNRTGVAEPIFDCHVPHPADRYEWFADGVFDEQPFARFGVRIDDDLRPVDERGDPEFANLRAAGSVVGGYDFAAEKSGSGVSLATGVAAGRAASEEIRQ